MLTRINGSSASNVINLAGYRRMTTRRHFGRTAACIAVVCAPTIAGLAIATILGALIKEQIVIIHDPLTEAAQPISGDPHKMITGLSPQAVNITARH